MSVTTPLPYDSPVLSRARAERLNRRMAEAGATVRSAVRQSVERRGDALVGRLVHGDGHLGGIAGGIGPSVGLASALLAAGTALGVLVAALGVATALAIPRGMTPDIPREALWAAEVLPVAAALAGLAVAFFLGRRLFARNVDEMAGVPRRLVRESGFLLGVGRDRLYVGTVASGGPDVREIPYDDLGAVSVTGKGLELLDRDRRTMLSVGGCWDAGNETEMHGVVSHLRHKAGR